MQFSLHANLHSQTYGILTVMTFESERVSDFRPLVIFAVKWHRICYLGYATFRSDRFCLGTFRSDYEILHGHILIQTYLNQREVVLKKNYKHDPRSKS